MVTEVWRPAGAAGFRTLQVYVRPESLSSGTMGSMLTAVSLFPSSIKVWKDSDTVWNQLKNWDSISAGTLWKYNASMKCSENNVKGSS